MLRFLPFYLILILIPFLDVASYAQEYDNYNLFETEFNWMEIEDIGTPLEGLEDNGFQGPFPIGFPFQFFGRIYEEYWISANGFIGFGPTINYSSIDNQELPFERPPNNIIALYWKDLDPEAFWADGVVYRGMRDDKLIVQYEMVGERNNDGTSPANTITMQLVLEPDGDILFQYETIGEAFDLEAGTVGVEKHNGRAGFTAWLNGEAVAGDIEIEAGTAFLISQHGPSNFLVWDASSNTRSGTIQARTLRWLSNPVTHLGTDDDLPEQLVDFDGVFINLGNHGEHGDNCHVLTDEEGAILANYLDDGGSLYLEGSDTWFRDDATEVHQYFNIEGLADGASLEPPVIGIEGSFGEGLVFRDYQAEDNRYVDHLAPRDNAESVFTFRHGNRDPIGMVAYTAEDYKTVGCSFEIGALVDGDEGTRRELIRRIVEFFYTPPPAFPPPVNLQAEAGDGEVRLSWGIPQRDLRARGRILELEREIARLIATRDGSKPDIEARERIYTLRCEIEAIEQELTHAPQRDELHGFNVHVDDELHEFTNSRQYTVVELENGHEYAFTLTAVYRDPDGESEFAGPVVIAPVGTIEAPFEMDFEDSGGGLFSQPAEDAWQWGEPEIGAASGERAWGTLLEDNYPDLAEFYLRLPIINLEELEAAWLGFTHYMDSEGGFDGGRVELSFDNGRRWTVLEPRDGYPEETIFAFDGQPGFSGRTDGWEQVTFDLSEYIGERVNIRFVFKSDDSFNDYLGWFIDDLAVFVPEFGTVQIEVTNSVNGDPVAGALVRIGDFWSGYTDIGGRTRWVENVPAGEHSLIIDRIGYLTNEGVIDVIARENNIFDVELELYESHLLFRDLDELNVQLEFGQSAEREVTIENDWEMETEYQILINFFPRGQNPEQLEGVPENGEVWELLATYDLTSETGEQYFTGVQFVRFRTPGTYRLVASAGNFGSGQCRFYIYSRAGRFLNSVIQDHWRLEGWGGRDMAYDGDFVYASMDPTIFAANPFTGMVLWREIVPEFDLLAINRAITYVPEDDAFWIGDWDDNWFKINREGEVLDVVRDHGLEGVVGMGWNPDDPDGAFLYVHNQESEDGGAAIYRFNPETRELEDPIETAGVDEGSAGGIFISYLYDTHSYVLGALIQGPDRDFIKLYQLQRRQSWLMTDHSRNNIPGEDQRLLTISFDATGLIGEVEAEIELHDLNTGGIARLPCTLEVVNGPGSIGGTVTLDGEGDVTEVDLNLNGIEQHPAEDGSFLFEQLMPGIEYTLRIELEGFVSEVLEGIELEPDQELVLDEIVLHPPIVRTIQGTVTSVYEENLDGVEITAVSEGDDRFFDVDTTGDDGSYLLQLPSGNYTVRARLNGWSADPIEAVNVIDDNIEDVDFVMDDRLGVRSVRADGYHDDRIELVWLEAGANGIDSLLQWDDGELANGVYMFNRNDIIAVRFEPEGVYDILSLSIYILTDDDLDDFGLPNNWDNSLFFKVFIEDPETGLPGELVIDEEVREHFDDVGWTTINIEDARFLEGPVFFGWHHDPNQGNRYEIAGLDPEFDNEGTHFVRIDDEWSEYNRLTGDMMARMVIWKHFEDGGGERAPTPARALRRTERAVNLLRLTDRATDKNNNIKLINPAFTFTRKTGEPFNWREIYSRLEYPRRDPFISYLVYVDGEPEITDEDDYIDTDWTHYVGSDGEDEEHTYRVTALYTDDDERGDAEVTTQCNMPPGSISFVRVDNDGLDFTIRWTVPEINEDGSDCEDFNGTQVYFNDDLVAELGADELSWNGPMELGEEGWYDFRLIAFDEVPNLSRPLEFQAPLGVAEIYTFEWQREEVFTADPEAGGWERSDDNDCGPCGAHSGRYYWATRPIDRHDDDRIDGRYLDNVDWSITTVSEYLIESESAGLDFYHYFSTEEGHDGGHILISVDGGSWEIIEPEGEYPDRRIAALRNEPGYSGDNGAWVLASFDLTPYIDHAVRFKWRFASDASISWFAGWYIDDMVLWGCSEIKYARVSGSVRDQNERPVTDAVVSIGRSFTTSDDEGQFVLTHVFPGETVITAFKPGYPDVESELEVEPDGEHQVDLEMYHPQVEADPDEIAYFLGGNDNVDTEFILSNRSEIPLSYHIILRSALGGMRDLTLKRTLRSIDRGELERDDPWDVIFDFNLTQITGLERIMGAEFADNRFFITAGDPVRGAVVAVTDRNGGLTAVFDQPFEPVGWGMRDLAWDGEFLYASQNRNIVAFTLEGEALDWTISSPLTLNRALAYDPEVDGFWTAEWNDPFYLIDREGEVLYEWYDHGLSGVYGLAYHPGEPPDEMPLYVLNREADGRTGIYRANPHEGEIDQVHVVESAPNGCFITGSWDSDLWMLGGVFGTDDQHLMGFELGERHGWLHVDPIRGELDPDESEVISVAIRIPNGASADDDYTGEISIRAFGAEQMVVPVEIEIIEGFRHFDNPEVTNRFMTLLIDEIDLNGDELPVSSEVAAITPRGDVGGAVRWTQAPVVLIAYHSDTGFNHGERFVFRVWDANVDEEYELAAEFIEGLDTFFEQRESVVRLFFEVADAQTIVLNRNWNLISTYINPNRPDITDVLSPVFDADLLIIVKDENGNFWWPEFNYNGLDDWDVLRAYQIKVRESTEFDVVGERIDPDTPIELDAGWNMVSYLLPDPVDCEVALEGIVENLWLAKNDRGDFYAPRYGYNGLGDMEPGLGYKLYMMRGTDLVYNPGDELGFVDPQRPEKGVPSLLTGSDMSLLITDAKGVSLEHDIELSVVAGMNDRVVGSATMTELPCGVVIVGDDTTTSEIEGARDGEELSLFLNTDSGDITFKIDLLAGEMVYHTDSFTILELEGNNDAIPAEFAVERVYPNPFNNFIRISFGVPETIDISLFVRDLSGRRVYDLPRARYNTGWHSLSIDASTWSSGIYLAELSSPMGREQIKLVLMR